MSNILWDVSTAVIDITPIKEVIKNSMVDYAPKDMWEYVLGWYLASIHYDGNEVRIDDKFALYKPTPPEWAEYDLETVFAGKMRYLSEHNEEGYPILPHADVGRVIKEFMTPICKRLNIVGLTLSKVHGRRAIVHIVRDGGGDHG